jgi:RNA polymerase sigma-70 factor (ECF subfamily)
LELVERVLRTGRPGAYQLQAAISAVHAQAKTAEDTGWPQIVALYDLVVALTPSPVVALASGVERGLELVDSPDISEPLPTIGGCIRHEGSC